MLLAKFFTESERSEVTNYVEVGEFGLALDNMVDIIIEERKQVGVEILDGIVALAALMGLDTACYKEKVTDRVLNN